ncbi:hypothetical protein N7532_000290 [Penicillium argentinense]|uniref:Uncharacterized protein n=1 Tax=Penicillium argentinense TaxID=1131581 RepID=A0A9W9KN45_9EURO|nr:uncharacterized protein N7532_000290 [Penicillium argentinense]KAJ5112245.1 hypothetical protein N7532_000290 [Penicillium argentinense]
MSTLDAQAQSRRHRGRPCKDTTGTVDAARRQQIREAQRTYRSRQQGLLTSLKERNSQLEYALTQLAQIMQTFRKVRSDPVLPQSGLPGAVELLEDEIARQLKRVGVTPGCSKSSHFTQCLDFQENLQQRLAQPSSSLGSAVIPSSPPSISTNSESPFWASFLQTSHPLIPGACPMTFEACVPLSTFTIGTHDRPIPYTTTQFTQKLFRACARSGYRLLTCEAVTDHEMWHEFGLMLRNTPRKEIIAYFQRVLAVTPCNPIEDFRFPYICLGGAGTHFPRERQMSIGFSGLQNLLPFQTTNGIREVFSEEEWFDVHDVEGYLAARNIQVKNDGPSNLSTDTRSISSGLSSSDLASFKGQAIVHTAGIPEQRSEFSAGLSRALAIADREIGDQFLPPFDHDTSLSSTMSVDENTIIKGLSRLCIGIGCAAAFRRRDVEAFIAHNVEWAP